MKIVAVRGGKEQSVRGEHQDRATGETPERVPIGELRPDDRGQDEVREALEVSADGRFISVSARLSAPVTSEDHIQGPIDATVTLVQYGDHECPYTRMQTALR